MNLAPGLNDVVFRFINNTGEILPWLDPVMAYIAQYMVFVLALVVIVFWFTRRKQNRLMILCAMIAFVIAEVVGKIAGKLYGHHQPFATLDIVEQLIPHEIDNSFPSDHTLLFFSICVTFWLFRKGHSYLWVLLALLVGISRIWVGVHYPIDVITAALIGGFAAVVVYLIIPRLQLTHKLLGLYDRTERAILPGQ